MLIFSPKRTKIPHLGHMLLLDNLVEKQFYANRNDAIRDAARDMLINHQRN